MLKLRILAVSLAVPAAVACLVSASSQAGAVAASQTWDIAASQVSHAKLMAITVATADNPAEAADVASRHAIVADTTRWPSNVASARIVGVSRGDALSLLGTPDAAPAADAGATVILIELQGQFTPRNLPMPPDSQPGTYNYLQLVIDATSGFVVDWGFVDAPVDLPAQAQTLQ